MKSPRSNNCTPVPDWLFDDVMPRGSAAQFKFTALVIRCTLGSGYCEAAFTQDFLRRAMGEGPLDVKRGIKEALERGYIGARIYQDTVAYRLTDLDDWKREYGLKDALFVPEEA